MKYTTFALLWLMLAVLFQACGKKSATTDTDVVIPPAGQEIAVRLAPVERYDDAAAITATGTLASSTETRLSFKIGGVIQKLYVEEGARVQKGQLLAKLNLTEIQAQVSQAEYGMEKARRDLERVQNLYRDSAATLEQVQNLQTVLDLARQNLEIARFNLQYAEIRAPHSGIAIKKIASEGELTSPGAPVYVLHGVGPADWVVKAGLSDKDWARLRLGDAADIRLDAYPGQVFRGRVALIPAVADPANGLYTVECKLDARDQRFASGLFATVAIQPRATAAQAAQTRVPIEAIVEGDGKRAFVFVPQGDSVRKVPVLIAELTNTHVVVAQGLEGIDKVITAGSPWLNERSKIRIME